MARRTPWQHRREHIQFFRQVGLCITRWSAVEEELFHICAMVLATDARLASIVYFRSPTIETRLGLVAELVAAVLPERYPRSGGREHALVLEWRRIDNFAHELTPVRNAIAHHQATLRGSAVMKVAADPNEPPEITASGPFISFMPTSAERLRRKTPMEKEIRLPALVEHYQQVDELTDRVRQYSTQLAALLQPKSA